MPAGYVDIKTSHLKIVDTYSLNSVPSNIKVNNCKFALFANPYPNTDNKSVFLCSPSTSSRLCTFTISNSIFYRGDNSLVSSFGTSAVPYTFPGYSNGSSGATGQSGSVFTRDSLSGTSGSFKISYVSRNIHNYGTSGSPYRSGFNKVEISGAYSTYLDNAEYLFMPMPYGAY
jgi:hypothetical protein